MREKVGRQKCPRRLMAKIWEGCTLPPSTVLKQDADDGARGETRWLGFCFVLKKVLPTTKKKVVFDLFTFKTVYV